MHAYEEKTTRVGEEGLQAPNPVIRLHANDDVVIARHQLVSGTRVADENVVVAGLIPPGHKMATRHIAAGEPVHRYNQIIGLAKQDIQPGQHVHTHNLEMTEYERDYAFARDAVGKRLFFQNPGDAGHRVGSGVDCANRPLGEFRDRRLVGHAPAD